MKRTSRVLAILLALAMLLSVTAFAATTTSTWTGYGGDNTTHNAAVTSAPTKTSATVAKIDLLNSGSGWDGVDNVPVMRTVGSTTYAYVFYDGHGAGAHLAKIDCTKAIANASSSNLYDIAKVWDIQISNSSGFQLSTPVLVPGATEADDVLYLAGANAGQVLNDPTLDTLKQGSTDTWTKSGCSIQSGEVVVAAGATATLTQSGFTMVSAPAKRVAIGVFLGNTTSTDAIGTTASIGYNLNGTSDTKTYATTDEIVEEVLDDNGNVVSYDHYFYLNENIGAVAAADTNQITFTVTMTGGTGTIEYGKVYQHTGSLLKVTNLNETNGNNVSVKSLTESIAISQQINTPVTTAGNYIYFGTWGGGSRAGTYYQVNLTDGTIATFTPSSYGFYWAGAAVVGNYVYFGSDNGNLYWRSVSDFASNGGSLALPVVGSNAAGNVRSSIMVDGTKIYFTTQYPSGSSFGNFYCYDVSNGTPSLSWGANIQATYNGTTYSGNCTSTPVIAASGNIYVGFYSGFTAGGLMKITAPTSGTVGTASLITVNGAAFTEPVQCTPVVYSAKSQGEYTEDYFYFNTNSSNGAGYCFSVPVGGTDATQVWATTGDTYALGGMAITNKYAVFGNDYNHLYVVK